MLGNILRSTSNVLYSAVDIVNTGLTATACGLNTLNQEIKEISDDKPLTEAQKFLQQPSMAMEFLNQNKKSGFHKEPSPFLKEYNLIGIKDEVIVIKDGDEVYVTELSEEQYPKVISGMKSAKNLISYMHIVDKPKTDKFSIWFGNQELVLWSDLAEVNPEEIEYMARLMIAVIEEINQ